MPWVIGLALALMVWVVFGQTRHHDFVNFDDGWYVYENPAINRGLGWNSVLWAFTHTHGDNWHPLTSLSHMMDCQLYGLNPGGHHLTNVLLHAATAILLFVALRNMTGAIWRSAFVAAVFAIHPLRAESVAWVAERKDVLSGLFFMLTLWAYARYAQGEARGQRSSVRGPWSGIPHLYLAALFFFVCGLMSKPMLVTLPFILLLLDYWPLNRITFPFRPPHLLLLKEKVPFLLLAIADALVTVLAQENAIAPAERMDFRARLINALVAYGAYLGQLFYPAGLAVFYPHPEQHLPMGQLGLSALVLLVITAVVAVGQRRHPFLLVGWLWYLGMLVPVIGLVQVGAQARADRYTYLPHIGVAILTTWGVVELAGTWRHRRTTLALVAAVVIAILTVRARAQTRHWQNSVSLWRHALECTSGNETAHLNLSKALIDQGDWSNALQHCEQAIQIRPDSAAAHINLSKALIHEGRLVEAMRHCERALQLKPNGRDAALAHNNLGYVLKEQGRLSEALSHFKQASQLDPDSASAHLNLGNALFLQGNWPEAIQHYQQMLQYKPDDAVALMNIGLALDNQGRTNEALPYFQKALPLASAQNNAALVEALRARLAADPSIAPTLSRP